MNGRSIAVLIDGSFFLKRLPKLVDPRFTATPEGIASCIRHLVKNHVRTLTGSGPKDWNQHLYRVFFYDAVPYDGKAHHPIDNRSIDYAKSDVAKERLALFAALRKQRKLALRLGKVNKEHDWAIKPHLTKSLLRSRKALSAFDQPAQPSADGSSVTLALSAKEYADLLAMRDLWNGLTGSSVSMGLRQKGVDMRIGIDIAALALKQQVDTIVLVSGDSDFVPAAKLARREGIDVVLDPLWQQINDDLFEHIDGLQSGFKKPAHDNGNNQQAAAAVAPAQQD